MMPWVCDDFLAFNCFTHLIIGSWPSESVKGIAQVSGIMMIMFWGWKLMRCRRQCIGIAIAVRSSRTRRLTKEWVYKKGGGAGRGGWVSVQCATVRSFWAVLAWVVKRGLDAMPGMSPGVEGMWLPVGSNGGLRVEWATKSRDTTGHYLIKSCWEGYIYCGNEKRIFFPGRSNEHLLDRTELINPTNLLKSLLYVKKLWHRGCWFFKTTMVFKQRKFRLGKNGESREC